MSIFMNIHDQGIIRTREPWEETVTDFTAMEIYSMGSIKQNFLNELEGTFPFAYTLILIRNSLKFTLFPLIT